MKDIVQRIWREPAVAIGLFASLVLLLLQFIGDDNFTADSIIAICAPFVSALGIRQVVTPTIGPTTTEAAPVVIAPPTEVPPPTTKETG